MPNFSRQLFEALLRNHPVDARAAFESGIRQKIQDALDLKKVEVAHGVFNEDHGSGFYVKHDGKEDWYRNREDAEAAAREIDGATVVADLEDKE